MRLIERVDDAAGCGLAIVFSLRHQWAVRRLGVPAIHEFHSLSAGRARWIKDMVKRHGAPRAVARIFTESHIQDRFDFAETVPTLLRPVGVDAAIFGCATGSEPEYDLI